MVKINKLSKLCIVTSRYPTKSDPAYTFVDKLVCAIADQGVECVVISPYSISANMVRGREKVPRYRERVTNNNNIIRIYHPRYFSLSNKSIMGFNTGIITKKNFEHAVEKTLKRLNDKFDALYGHFIMPSGMSVNNIGKKRGIPSFLAYGECSIDQFDFIGLDRVRNELKDICGVISVSTANKDILVKHKIIDESKIKVFPNAIDRSIFYQRDKDIMRDKLNIDKKDFVVIFVGYFIERKGPKRVLKALENEDVKLIFVGSGPQIPNGDKVLFAGRVEHDNIPEMLSAADVFVLPTLAEGCCNSIIEAMSCGLPIISSDLPFNYDIIDESNSILVNPYKIDEIRDAILDIKNNKNKRMQMSIESLKKSNELSIENRAKRIISYIESKI